MLKRKNRRAEIQEDFEKQIERYGDYIPNKNKINVSPNEKMGCAVCGKILRRGGMKMHRMSLKCKALKAFNIKLCYS